MGGSSIWEKPEQISIEMSIVVVTISYRLNIFGFATWSEFGDSSLPYQANFGFLDQQLALSWVQQNVGAFGGDKNRVTLNGQSSGGTSIMALMSSPLSKGLFAGAISLSGSPNMTMQMKEQAWPQFAPFVDALGCGKNFSLNATVRLACLRNRTQSELQSVVTNAWNTPELWGIESLSPAGRGFFGLPIVDGKVIVDGGFETALRDGIVDVPFMYGNLANECDVDPNVDVSSYTQQQWLAYLNTSSLAAFLAAGYNPSIATDIYSTFQNADPMWSYSSFNTAYGLTCGSIQINQQAAGSKVGRKAPLYYYYNNWAPSHPVPLGLRVAKYPYHGQDWDFACSKWPLGWEPQDSDLKLKQTLQSVWYEFMATGRLNSTTTGWKPVDDVAGYPNNYNVVVIQPQETTSQVNFYNSTCSVLSSYGLTQPGFWWVN
jgi:carboxylesterase type B